MVLVKELQSLALDVTVFDDEVIEIDLKQDYDDTEDSTFTEGEEFTSVNDAENADGFSIETHDEDEIDDSDVSEALLSMGGNFDSEFDEQFDFDDAESYIQDTYESEDY